MPDPSTDGTGTTPDLLASTGLNDPNSPWNLNGLLQTALQTGVNAGQDALQRALGQQTPLSASATNGPGAPANPPGPASPFDAPLAKISSKWPVYVLWVAALALVAWVLLGERR